MPLINKVYSRQILDSRGNPTLEVELELNNGIFCKTKNGEKALNLFHLYSDIYKHIDKLIDIDSYFNHHSLDKFR